MKLISTRSSFRSIDQLASGLPSAIPGRRFAGRADADCSAGGRELVESIEPREGNDAQPWFTRWHIPADKVGFRQGVRAVDVEGRM